MDFLYRLSIKQRLLAGFIFILVLTALIAAISVLSANRVQHNLLTVSEELQPSMVHSLQLQAAIKEGSTNLGFYLLSKNDTYRENFEQSLLKVQEVTKQLTALSIIQNNAELINLVNQIKQDSAKLNDFKVEVYDLAENPLKNLISLGFASEKINPPSMEMLNAISMMISAEAEEPANAQRRELLKNIQDLRYDWATLMTNIRTNLMFNDDATRQNIELYYNGAKSKLAKIIAAKDLLNFEQEEGLATVMEKISAIDESLPEMRRMMKEVVRRDELLIKKELGPLFAKLDSQVHKLIKIQSQKIVSTNTHLIDEAQSASIANISLMIIGLLFGSFAAVLTIRSIINPLNTVQQAMNNIASGDGDLTQRITVKGNDEIARVGQDFNTFISDIHRLVEHLSSASEYLVKSSLDIRNFTEQSRQGATEQADETNQVAQEINHLSQSMFSVTENTGDAEKHARDANDASHAGIKVVKTAVDEIESMANEMENAKNVMNSLEQESQKIDKIMEVIKGIAEQTNLLALNAAIEAARAGDQGRGFAVVADEVRNLANKTQSSISDIHNLVENLQTSANQASQVIESSRSRAQESVKKTIDAGTALQKINETVELMAKINIDIAEVTRQQQEKLINIQHAANSISEITNMTKESAADSAQASISLGQLAGDLQDMLVRYKV